VDRKKRPAACDYALDAGSETRKFAAPALDYRPPRPEGYRPRIGLIGCGGITSFHLEAYRRLRFPVVAFCDVDTSRAAERRDQYTPQAEVYREAADVLARDDIDIVDVATHPRERETILAEAIRAGKHVLSQKPFVIDLQVGRKLVAAARRRGVLLAVNQNGRWAPHFSYLRQAIAAGWIGDVAAVDISIHWDHSWVRGTPFERIPHLLLYDFAIHWFDILHCLTPGHRPLEVAVQLFRGPHQSIRPPLQANVAVRFRDLLATLVLNGNARYGACDRTVVTGTQGTLVASGRDLNHQRVSLYTDQGVASPRLQGSWFTSGFQGTMAELATAVAEQREPSHAGRDNLQSLQLAFAAIAGADWQKPVKVGSVQRLDPKWIGAG
jgi:predicted dehydrogenase